MTSRLINLLVLTSLFLLTACEKAADTKTTVQAESATVDSETLATVNGEPITQADVDFMIQRTFSGSEQLFFDDAMQSKVLDSLIATEAMRQSVVESLSESELNDIRNRAKAYEDELYIKAYLQQHASPEPVSAAMVNDYYTRYPEEFDGGERRDFEMLTTGTRPDENQRDALLATIDEIRGVKNWESYTKNTSFGLNYKRATMVPGLLDPALEQALQSAEIGESSGVIMVKGVPHIVRVLNVDTLPAKPLSEVSAQIRKKLAALQLKKAVKAASETAISQAEVSRP